MKEDESNEEQAKKLTFWEVLGSTFSAALGVQSFDHRRRDFTHGNIKHFILSGIIFTACLVGLLVGLVNWVLL